jgi:hypothetical protein
MRRLFWRALPPLLLLAFYWPALTGWFFQDDFGWLRLPQGVHSAADLPAAVFAPKAHGNMRPLGENAYWMALGGAFGAKALPFRVVTFATQMAALLLLGAIVERLTKSRAAGFCAAVLWVASCGLAPAMGWSSIYNQVLSGFFFLLALYFLQRYAETGERRWWVAQWIAFVLGLGALETNVVYPALAALYALWFARPILKKTLPMLLVSALSAAVHFHFAPAPHAGVYAPHVDPRVFGTLWTYWSWALGRMPMALAALLAAAALAFAAGRALRRDYGALFALTWFVVTLAPYLVLPDHKMEYYLAVPTIGIAMLGAAAVAAACRARLPWKALATAGVLCYLAASGSAAWAVTRWEHDRGRRVEDLVAGVAEIRQSNPGKAILLDGMDDELFWSGMVNLPFHAIGIPEVFLAPGPPGSLLGVSKIQAPADLLTRFVLPPELTLRTLRRCGAVVYRVDSDLLRNETNHYRALAEAAFQDETPRFINIGDAIFGEFLGAGWDPASEGHRSMRRTASLSIGGPRGAGASLYIGVFRTRDFGLRLSIDGAGMPLELVYRDNDLSEFRAPLPSGMIGRPVLKLSLATDLEGPLTFGYAEIR